MSDTNSIESNNLTPEELLGPPQIDFLGLSLISFLSLVIWLLVGVGVFMLVYFSFGEFLFQSWAASVLIAMYAFLCLTIGNVIYMWGLSSIFPHIYNSVRTIFVQTTVFSIILFVCMSIVYFFIGSFFPSTIALLWVYAIHVLLNAFGILLLAWILSQYKYSLLTLYSSFIALIFSWIIIFWIYTAFSDSGKILFLFIGLASTVYLIVTVFHFGIGLLYIKLYTLSWADPLGDVLQRVETEERLLDKRAEESLFTKK